MTAREALRKSRATMDHGEWGAGIGCEGQRLQSDIWKIVETHLSGSIFKLHAYAASALLDGFTAAAVTRAERDLARESQP